MGVHILDRVLDSDDMSSALGGFAKPDVDSYICALLGKAAELREKLCS